MTTKYDGKYHCGYCKKTTAISDQDLADRLDAKDCVKDFGTPCPCGHFSYGSGITFKAGTNKEDWCWATGKVG